MSTRTEFLRSTGRTFLGGLGIIVLVFCLSLVPAGSREISPLKNIHGIPFSKGNGTTHIEEALAHADIDLHEPVFSKQLVLDVGFIPHHTRYLAVGVRQNSFWLSYNPELLFAVTNDPVNEVINRRVTIPLAGMLQERDRSIDVMFFASDEIPVDPATLISQPADWELVHLNATVERVRPTIFDTLGYLVSIGTRERAL